ncbi:Uncharacterized protein PRO82_000210 [Candidatus Protochlamydia amoebophila]|nr:Uncharacterized protein [Candidatus Protochlamydia amoebophila]
MFFLFEMDLSMGVCIPYSYPYISYLIAQFYIYLYDNLCKVLSSIKYLLSKKLKTI